MSVITITVLVAFVVVMIVVGLIRMNRQDEVFVEMEDEIVMRKALLHFEKAVGRYGRTVNSFGRSNIACYAQALVAKYENEFSDKTKVDELKQHLNRRIGEVSGIRFGSAAFAEPNVNRTELV